MDNAARKLEPTPVAAAAKMPASAAAPNAVLPPHPAPNWKAYAQRWLALHWRQLRAIAIGALSLALFLLAWHLLTTYRVSFHVRFVNVPSPEMVLESLKRALHSSTFMSHVALSCRRIFFGFMTAAVVALRPTDRSSIIAHTRPSRWHPSRTFASTWLTWRDRVGLFASPMNRLKKTPSRPYLRIHWKCNRTGPWR